MITNDNKGINQGRAGDYVSQIGGYKAFVPKPLPPDPPIQLDREMLLLLSQADMALGRLDGMSAILPNVDLFVAMYVNKEAVLSSQIEGTQASLIDVLAFEADAALPGNPQDIEEVINYINALNFGLQRLNTLPLSLRLIREIHSLLLQGVRGANRQPGEFRTSQNWIGHHGGTIGTARFVPPSPTDMNTALNNLETFINTEKTIPILLKVGLVHAHFETIHPFLDGNGRVGRLLITFILCYEGILRKPLLYLSHFFKVHRSEYYRHLQKIRDDGDWETWLKFFLRGVYEVAQEATTTASNIVQLRELHRNIVATQFPRLGGTYQLLEYLYQRPVITVNGAAKVTGLSYANANRLVMKFQEHGLLRQMDTYQRNRRFIYADYLAMFSDEEMSKDEHQRPSVLEEEKTEYFTENGPESPALSKAGMNGRSFRAGWVEGKHHSSLVLCSPQDEERSSTFIVSRLRSNSCKSERRIRYPPLRPNLRARSCFSRIDFRTVRRVTGRSLPNWNSCVGM